MMVQVVLVVVHQAVMEQEILVMIATTEKEELVLLVVQVEQLQVQVRELVKTVLLA